MQPRPHLFDHICTSSPAHAPLVSPGGLLLPRGIPEALALAHLVPRLVGAPTRGAVVQGEAAQPVLLLLSCIVIQWNSFVLFKIQISC